METLNTTPLNNNDKRLKSFWVPLDGDVPENENVPESGDVPENENAPPSGDVPKSGEVPKNENALGYEYAEGAEKCETTPLRKPALSTRFFRVKEVPNTSIYAVLIDGVPKFYSASLDDAIRKARNFLEANRKHFDRKYFLDNLPNGEIHLTSVNKFFVFQNETLEHVAKICKIPQVRFMVQ